MASSQVSPIVREKRIESLLALTSRPSPTPQFDAASLKQPIWWIDPRNKSGNASDGNVGDVQSKPIQHWSVIPARYGTTIPILPQSTVYNFLSSSPHDGTDPIVLTPIMKGLDGPPNAQTFPFPTGSGVRINAAFGLCAPFAGSLNLPVATGVLAGVVVKNRATGQKLAADVGPGGVKGQMLCNMAAGKESICALYKNVGGNVWELTQPLTPSNFFPLLTSDPVPIDTYANGDPFERFDCDQIDLVEFIPITCDYDSQNTNLPTMTGVGIAKASAPNLKSITRFGPELNMFFGRVDRLIFLPVSGGHINNLFGVAGIGGIRGGYTDVDDDGASLQLRGGFWGGANIEQAVCDQDVIFSSAFTRFTGGTIGSVCVDTGAAIAVEGEALLLPYSEGAQLWGGGAIDVRTGRVDIQGTTAVAGLLQLGGSRLSGHSNAFTATLANPSVVNGAVAVTPANIDANGFMYWPGGGSIAIG